MFHAGSAAASAGLCFVSLCASPEASATPASSVTGYGFASTRATTGGVYAGTFTSQIQNFGTTADGAYLPAVFAGSADAASRGTATFPVTPNPPVGDLAVSNTTGEAYARMTWRDALTFHTSDPLGIDYRFSITLLDALSTSIRPGPAGHYTDRPGAIVQNVEPMRTRGGTIDVYDGEVVTFQQ